MLISELELLNEKSKKRKDGIYSYGQYYYAVKDKVFKGYVSKIDGRMYQVLFSFTVDIAKVKPHESKKELKKWLKSHK